MKAIVKKIVEISMSEEEAIRLGSEIESIISEVNALMESKVAMSTANSVQIINNSVGTGSTLRSVFDTLEGMAENGLISAR